jgi:large repetitive protein
MERERVKARTRGLRGRAFVGFALFVSLMFTALVVVSSGRAELAAPPPPQVWSDKADYAPGETVTLSGANWAVGEAVHLVVNDDAGQTWRYENDVTAGADGTFSVQFNLPDWFVAQYSVTATGASSGTATWSFTDGNVTLHLPSGLGVTSITVRYDIYGKSGGGGFVDNTCSGAVQSSGTLTVNSGSTQNIPGFGSNNLSVRLGTVTSTPTGKTIDFWAAGDKNSEFSPQVSLGATPCISSNPGSGTNGNVTDAWAHLKNLNSAPAIGADDASVTVAEGQTAANTGTWSDANAGDTVTLSASVGTITKSGTNASGTWSWSFGTSDGPAQSQTVTITADDGNGGVTSTTFSLVVNNVAPTATFANNGPVSEGSNINLSLTSPSDPSSADTAAGFEYAFDCGSGYGAFGASNTASCPTNDNGSRSVKGKIKDKDGGVTEYTASVAINNVAPTATFSNTGPVNEGSSFQLSLTGASDPSSVDTAAGFTYAFDCGDGSGYGAFSSTNSASCSTTDDGNRSVKGKVKDKDGGVTEYTATVTVQNVAPTISSVTNDGPIDEGGSATVTVTASDTAGAADPLSYEFDCDDDATYEAGPQAGNSHACSFADDGSYQVNVRVSDGDGGFATGSTTVTVRNVAPSVSISGPVTVNENKNGSETYHFDVVDPGADGFTVVGGYPDCGTGGSLQGGVTFDGDGHGGSFDCRFADGPADPKLTIQVRDADEAAGSPTADSNVAEYDVHVNNVAPTVNLSGPGTADEGTTKTYTFTLSDPGADTFSFVSGPPTDYPTCGEHGQLIGTPTVAGGSFQCYFPDGPNTTDVAVKVQDDDGGVSTPDVEQVDIVQVTIANVPPTVTAPDPQGSDEGQSKLFLLGSFTDPGTDADWKVDVDWGDTTSEPQFAVGSTGIIPAHSHAYADDGTYTVTVTVTDKDGASDSKTFEVTVANIAPTATFDDDGPVDEGSSFHLSLADPFDPSSVDTAAGFEYAFDCGDGSGYGAFGSSNTATCPTDDNASRSVKGKVKDKDGGVSEYTGSVEVKNVAPTATFHNDGPVDEGTSFHLSLTGASDPSSADTAAGFQYSFDCGDGAGYGAFGSSNAATCPTSDNAVRSVRGRIKDKDGGVTEYTDSVTVKNVAPTVALSGPTAANEGETKSYSYSWTDPGSADTFPNHSVDCGPKGTALNESYTPASKSGSFDCRFGDDSGAGTFAVKATVQDDDGGEGADTKQVDVDNVDPAASNPGFVFNPVLGTATASFDFADVGWLDTHQASFFTWSGGVAGLKTVTEENAYPDATGTATEKRTFVPGCYNLTVTGTAKDDDGGMSPALSIFSGSTTGVYSNGFRAPIQDNERNIAKYGNVVPVKVALTNPCTGGTVTNVSLFVQLLKGLNGEYIEDVNTVTESASAADSGQQMRVADGMYIYNLSTKGLVANTDYAVQIRLGSLSGPTILQAILQPKK